ncbi:MAG: GspH/FimT family pseudopilin [Magnetococcales bacterium]|nr:GspH/FimT family pseudopilin [Magnetococcales bacterium]MBF0114023.1 GspH/FimT family pseudopilin [Magnetococcales bacterium]
MLPHPPRFLCDEAGYTLSELLLALAVLAIVTALAIPSLTTLLLENRLTTYSNQLNGALQLARSEAVKRGQTTTFCGSHDGKTCAGSWNEGWLILAGSAPLQTFPALEGRISLHFTLSNGTLSERIQFNAQGFSIAYAGTWRFCDPRGSAHARALLVNSSGRVSSARDSNHNGIPEDDQGQELLCS